MESPFGPPSPRYDHFLVSALLCTFAPQTAINGPKQAPTGVGRCAAGAASVPQRSAMRARLATELHKRALGSPGCDPGRFGAVWPRFGPVWGVTPSLVGADSEGGTPELKTGVRGAPHWGRPTPEFQAGAGVGAEFFCGVLVVACCVFLLWGEGCGMHSLHGKDTKRARMHQCADPRPSGSHAAVPDLTTSQPVP